MDRAKITAVFTEFLKKNRVKGLFVENLLAAKSGDIDDHVGIYTEPGSTLLIIDLVSGAFDWRNSKRPPWIKRSKKAGGEFWGVISSKWAEYWTNYKISQNEKR